MREKATFDYKSFETWGEALIGDSADILSTTIIAEMQSDSDTIGSGSEILAWLDKRVFEVAGIQEASTRLVERLKRGSSHLRIYHGTRVESLYSFLEHGLMPGSVHRMENLAQEILGNGRFPGVTDELLANLFKELRPSLETQKDRVYFCVDDRNFDSAGHYLTYGSEYLCWVIARLQKIDRYGNDVYHRYLRSRGVPTVMVIDYPIEILPSRFESLWTEAVENLLWKLAERNKVWYSLDYTITLPGVHPSLISGHYHPSRTHDPFCGFDFRENSILTCDHCIRQVAEG